MRRSGLTATWLATLCLGAAACGNISEPVIERIAMPADLSVPLARVAAEVTGEAAAPIALALLPAWLHEHAALRTRTWPSDVLLARFLAQLGAWPERPGVLDDAAAPWIEDAAAG